MIVAMKPLQERLDKQDRVVEDLTKQLSSIRLDMDSLKAAPVGYHVNYSALQQQVAGLAGVGNEDPRDVEGSNSEAEYDDKDRVIKMCALGRKIIGFTPIEPRMLQLQIQSFGARDIEEAKLMEVKSYLKCEMKVKPSDIEKLSIFRIFPPAREDWNTL